MYMKLVSPKTLLASVLGIAFVVFKMMTFDGFADLFWILFIGYLTIKAVITAFSRQAHDADVKKDRQRKVLYRDLFGKFAYFVADIPLFLYLLAGLLALVFPKTALLRIVLLAMLFLVAAYVIWLIWYVSKNKRPREESGEWETGVLSAEEEKSWKRSERWNNIFLGIFLVLAVLYLIFGDPRIYGNNAKLKDALMEITDDRVTLEEVVPFAWTTVYTFDPYTSRERIEGIVGSNSPALKESRNEGMTHVVFTNRGRVVASVCEDPASLGYALSFSGGENTHYRYSDGGYSHVEYGDEILFEVTRENGLVKLYADLDACG